MNVEAWIRSLVNRFEIREDSVLCSWSEGFSQHLREGCKSVWVVRESEVVILGVLGINVHEVVQSDQVGFVVDIQDTGLDIIDVAAVVVDVLGRCLAIGQDIVIVTMINHEESARLDKLVEVLKALLMIPHVSVEVREMSKGVSEKNPSIKTTRRSINILVDSQPVRLLNDPVVEGWFFSSLPPGLVSSLQHFIRGIRRSHLED